MTSKDTYLTKEDYQQIVYASLREVKTPDQRIQLMKPAIAKPQQLWTGKQVVSTILKNLTNLQMEFDDELNKGGLNLKGKTKLKESYWGPLGNGEGEVIIKNNELLQGILDKNHLGETTYGLNHAIYEIYGSKKAGEWLTAMARCLT